jgi:hypothetical protein
MEDHSANTQGFHIFCQFPKLQQPRLAIGYVSAMLEGRYHHVRREKEQEHSRERLKVLRHIHWLGKMRTGMGM